jgi:transposase-like protein
MTDTPDTTAPEKTVTCPTCGSENTIQIGPRGPVYQCQDCTEEFKLNRWPANAEPDTLS